jgi:HEAT repeat protein
MRISWQKYFWIVAFSLVSLSGVCAQNHPTPDIRFLVQQLDTPNAGKDTFEKIVKLAKKDPRAREYVVQKLPEMIRGPQSDVWLDALRLAGILQVKEAIPALQEAMSRPPLPAEPYLTFAGIWRLDGDIVAKTLSQIGEPAIPAATTLLKSEDAAMRGRALLILRNIGSPAARRVLVDQLPRETDRENQEIIEDTLR